MQIQIHKLAFKTSISSDYIYGILSPISYLFQSGNIYLLNGGERDGGWALSWVIGGELLPSSGTVEKDGKLYLPAERRIDAWCVRRSQIKTVFFRKSTVRAQVRHGLRHFTNLLNITDEQNLIREFGLTPERYRRPLQQLSHEAWRASCAIGLVNGKKVFCFPYIASHRLESDWMLWFPDLLRTLKKAKSTVLLPTTYTPLLKDLADEVVPLKES